MGYITFENVCKHYQTGGTVVKAVDDVSFEIEKGEFCVVLGGLETVDLIASQPTNSSDKPKVDQTMRTVWVETYGQNYAFTKLDD